MRFEEIGASLLLVFPVSAKMTISTRLSVKLDNWEVVILSSLADKIGLSESAADSPVTVSKIPIIRDVSFPILIFSSCLFSNEQKSKGYAVV